MPVLSAGDAVAFEVHGSRFVSYVAPARGETQLCAWRLEVPPGTVGMPHAPTRDEVLLVLTGSMTVTLAGTTTELAAGGVIFVPAGTEFTVDAGPDGVTAWVTTTPGLEAVMGDGSRFAPPWAQ